MEKLKSEKNWDILGKKVTEYVPDEYTNEDWKAMSKMLDPGKPTFLQILKSYALLIMSALALPTILLVLTYSN